MADSVEYNLYTRFHFKNQPGMSQMKTTGSAFQHLHKSAKQAQAGIAQVNKGFQQIAMYGGAAGVAIWGLVKRGVAFDKAWHDVKAVATGTATEIERLRGRAKQLGATTLFTAEEAAKGMEELVRSGMSVGQTYKAIAPVLNLAIGDNVELAEAARTTAVAMNTFKISADKAHTVTDAFAYVSRNTMTNTTLLAESFKYAAPAATMAKQKFSDLMGTLGLLAQAGYRGSLAGTAYKNALMQLAKGSEAAYELFGGRRGFLKAATEKGKWKPFQHILDAAIKQLGKIENEAERAGLAFKIFGIRGIAALTGYKLADPEKMTAMLGNFEEAARGSAKEMADVKKQSLHGQWLLLRSAIDGVAISLFDVLRPTITKVMTPITDQTAKFATAIKAVHAGMSETDVVEKYGATIAGVIFGVKEAAVELWDTMKKTGKVLFSIFKQISGDSNMSTKRLVKLITKFTMLSMVLTPVVVGVGMLSLAFSGMFNVVAGGLRVVGALTSRWGIPFLILIRMFAIGTKEGESFVTTTARGLRRMLTLVNALIWPFKKLSEYIGAIPAAMLAITTFRIGKWGLAKLLTGAKEKIVGRLPSISKAGGILGGHGPEGMPVRVTNWPLGMQFGGGGAGGGLGGIAGRLGVLGRLKHLGAALGTGAGGLFTGGKLVTGGSAAAMGTTAKWAALGATAGTVTTALLAFGGALAPAIGGLLELSSAYTAEGKARKLAQLRRKRKEAEELEFAMDIFWGRRGPTGERKEKLLGYHEARTPQQIAKEALARRIGAKGVGQISEAKKALTGGKVWKARELLSGFGLDKFVQAIPQMTANDMKALDLDYRHLKVLEKIATASVGTIDAIEKGWQTTIQIDGKTVAVVNAKVVQDSRERSGKTPGPGARRRAIERGVP